jgi:hypothetical protein
MPNTTAGVVAPLATARHQCLPAADPSATSFAVPLSSATTAAAANGPLSLLLLPVPVRF